MNAAEKLTQFSQYLAVPTLDRNGGDVEALEAAGQTSRARCLREFPWDGD